MLFRHRVSILDINTMKPDMKTISWGVLMLMVQQVLPPAVPGIIQMRLSIHLDMDYHIPPLSRHWTKLRLEKKS